MKPALALALSASLNVVLALAATHLLRPPATGSLRKPAGENIRPPIELRIPTNLPPATTFATNRFHWRQLESTNYDEFVASLRAVGCPERTIRDILVADVSQAYAAREGRNDRPVAFWANGPRRVAAERLHEAELFQLRTELPALLRRLVGVEWSPDMKRDVFDDEQAICRLVLGEVSEEQFQRAYGLIVSAQAARKDIEWRARNVLLEEDYAQVRARRDECERQLRGLLSPAQFEEFAARAGIAESLFSSAGLEELRPSAAELRRIALAGVEVRPVGWKFMDLDDSQTDAEKESDKAALKRRFREILGEARFAELELLEDYNYRAIHSFARDAGLPLETAHKLHEVRALTASEVQELRNDKALDPAVREQRLAAVTANVSRAVNALLGSKFAEYSSQQSGQWVTNVNRL